MQSRHIDLRSWSLTSVWSIIRDEDETTTRSTFFLTTEKNRDTHCTNPIRTSVHKGLHWQHRRSDQINLVTSCVRGKLFRDCILGFLVNANTYAVEESSTAYTHHNSKTMTDWKVAQPERKVPITSFATTETSFWFGIASVSSPLDSGSPFRWLHGCRPSLVLSWGGRIHIHEYVYTTPTCMSWDSMELCQVLRRHACHEIVWNYATRHKGTRERVFWTQRKVRFWEGSRRHTLPLADLLSQNALSSYQTCKLRQ